MVPNPSYLGVLGKLSLAERLKAQLGVTSRSIYLFHITEVNGWEVLGLFSKHLPYNYPAWLFSSLTSWSQVASVAPGILSVFGEEHCRRKPLNFTFK